MRPELRCSQETFVYDQYYIHRITPTTHLAVIVLANFFFGFFSNSIPISSPWPLLLAKVILVEATCRWGKLKTCSQTHQMCYNSGSSL